MIKFPLWLHVIISNRHCTYWSWAVDCPGFLCHCSEQTQWWCTELQHLLEDYMMLCQLAVSHCNCSLHQKYRWDCSWSLGTVTVKVLGPEVWESFKHWYYYSNDQGWKWYCIQPNIGLGSFSIYVQKICGQNLGRMYRLWKYRFINMLCYFRGETNCLSLHSTEFLWLQGRSLLVVQWNSTKLTGSGPLSLHTYNPCQCDYPRSAAAPSYSNSWEDFSWLQ